jgi:hypothetical protein
MKAQKKTANKIKMKRGPKFKERYPQDQHNSLVQLLHRRLQKYRLSRAWLAKELKISRQAFHKFWNSRFPEKHLRALFAWLRQFT